MIPLQKVNKILLKTTPITNQQYKTIWAPCDGQFSVKTAKKNILHHQTNPIINIDLICHLNIQLKIRNFLCKIGVDALPTKTCLNKYFNRVLLQCIMCDLVCENANHILFHCDCTKNIIHNLRTYADIENVLENLSGTRTINNNFEILGIMWWSVWNYHNNIDF